MGKRFKRFHQAVSLLIDDEGTFSLSGNRLHLELLKLDKEYYTTVADTPAAFFEAAVQGSILRSPDYRSGSGWKLAVFEPVHPQDLLYRRKKLAAFEAGGAAMTPSTSNDSVVQMPAPQKPTIEADRTIKKLPTRARASLSPPASAIPQGGPFSAGLSQPQAQATNGTSLPSMPAASSSVFSMLQLGHALPTLPAASFANPAANDAGKAAEMALIPDDRASRHQAQLLSVNAPLIAQDVYEALPQSGGASALFGRPVGVSDEGMCETLVDPQVRLHANAPFTGVIRGAQGSGKSYATTIAPERRTDSSLRRHYGARCLISTQEPTVIPPEILDLSSFVLCHRMSSPSWASHLTRHIGAAKDANSLPAWFSTAVNLAAGEAIIFSSSSLVMGAEGPRALGSDWMRVCTRRRLTADGGQSVLAVP